MEAHLPRRRHPRAGFAPRGPRARPGRGRVPQRPERGVRPARPLPAQGGPALAGHRVRHQRGLPAAQLDHRPVHRPGRRARRGLHTEVRGEGGRRPGVSGRERAGHASARPRAPHCRPGTTHHLRMTMSTSITRSTCPYCGVGCGVLIETEGNQITGVRGDPDHTANFSKLCTKGTTLHLTATPTIARQTRLLQPMQRLARGAAPTPVGWDAALDPATERFAHTIAKHAPDAVGFYISGQLLTEDYYVFNKLAKGLIGTNNVDTNSRLCMSS